MTTQPWTRDEADWLDRASRAPLATYQTAAVRIGIAATWLLGLLRDFPNRHELWGPDAPWSWDLATAEAGNRGAFSILTWASSAPWFEACYLLSGLAALGLLLGWRTRASSVVFALTVASFQNYNDYLTNGGDNLLRLMAVYLVFTRCAEVWSLDARRRRAGRDDGPDAVAVALWAGLGGSLLAATMLGHLTVGWLLLLWGGWAVSGLPGVLRRGTAGGVLLDRAATLVHHAAIVVIVGQVCLVYATAGWYKIQGELWQNGTAVYYATHIEWLNAWPVAADLLAAASVPVLVLTYGTVLIQVAFPFSLFNRRVKNVLLCFLILEHIGIGLLMGLPYFSLTMIAADLIFLPTAAALWLQRRTGTAAGRLRRGPVRARRPGPGPGEAAAEDPEQDGARDGTDAGRQAQATRP